LFDADGLACKHLAQIDFPTIESDAAASRDRDGLVRERVVEVRLSTIRLRRRPIELRRTLHVERLAWSLVAVTVDEVIKPGLLLQEVIGSWLGGLHGNRAFRKIQ
jgi:hypothetical protein